MKLLIIFAQHFNALYRPLYCIYFVVIYRLFGLSQYYYLIGGAIFHTLVQCGFKALNQKVIKEVLPHVLDQEWFFDPELLFKSQKWGYKIKEIPIVWIEDTDSRVIINKMVKNNFISIIRTKLEFLTNRINPKEKNL